METGGDFYRSRTINWEHYISDFLTKPIYSVWKKYSGSAIILINKILILYEKFYNSIALTRRYLRTDDNIKLYGCEFIKKCRRFEIILVFQNEVFISWIFLKFLIFFQYLFVNSLINYNSGNNNCVTFSKCTPSF